jgi:tetratricopeptide (TPR) repeat protein
MPSALPFLLAVPLLLPGQGAGEEVHRSPEGHWQLVVLPGQGAAAAPPRPARAVLRGPGGSSPSFPIPFPRRPFEVVVEDDGSVLCFDDFDSHGLGVVLARLGSPGAVLWERSLEELLPEERLAELSQGSSSRRWRLRPLRLDWRFEEGRRVGFALHLWNHDRLQVELADGSARYEEVQDHGEDARAWFESARAASAHGRFEEAVRRLQRAVELDPSELGAWDELARCQELLGRMDAAIQALEIGSQANPIVKGKQHPNYLISRRNMHLHVRLAQAYWRVGREKLAEQTALACLSAEPAQWEALSLYLEILWQRGELEAARQFLATRWRHMVSPPSEDLRLQRLTMGALQAGDFFFQRALWKDARDYYRRGFERGEYHDLLYQRLARCHEEQGELALAIEVVAAHLEVLLRRAAELQDPRQRQGLEERIQGLEQQIARLDALEQAQGAVPEQR